MKRYLFVFAAIICALCSCSKTATDIILDTAQLKLCVGESTALTASVIPSDATNQMVYWSTSDSGVATVSNGVVKAVAPGEATVTVKTDDGGLSASCKVIVLLERINVETIVLNKSELTLFEEESDTLTATVLPLDATEKGIFWTSSNDKIAKVFDGIIVPVKASDSTAVITATTIDGNKIAQCTVNVKCKVLGLILDEVNLAINEGDTCTLKATVYPNRASNKGIKWSSSETSVATVDNSGLITGHKAGKAIITVETEDGGIKKECTVIVRSPVDGLKLSKASAMLREGQRDTIVATILPANASNKKIYWFNDDKDIVTIDTAANRCIVIAKAPGKAKIHVSTAEGGFMETYSVTVIKSVNGVTLDVNDKQLFIGSSFTLNATVAPADAYDKSVTWTSADSNIATVSNATVTAVAKGSTTITVKTNDGNFTAVCKVTVKSPVKSAALLESALLYKGESINLADKLTIEPANADYEKVIWVAGEGLTVKSNGEVTANTVGYHSVFAKVISGNDTITSTRCVLEVHSHIEGIALTTKTLSLCQGEFTTLDYTISPADADETDVKWSTSDDAILMVNSKGKIGAMAVGEADVIVETVYGSFTDRCHVTVTKPITGLSLDQTNLSLGIDKTYQLTALVTPFDLAGVKLIWKSSNEKVAMVSDNGFITPLTLGTTDITVSTVSGSHTATCHLTITDPTVQVKSILLNAADISLSINDTKQLEPTIKPADATDKSVEWSSSDSSVASVDANGLVTAHAVGSAVITVTALDGSNVSQSCNITVNSTPVSEISVSPKKQSINPKETCQLTVSVLPATAGDKTVTWSTGNNAVATVDSTGKVTAVSPGQATITVTSNQNPQVSDYCVITVIDNSVHVTGVKLDETSKYLELGNTFTLTATVTPSNATDKTLTWDSSNKNVATVDSTGKVTPVSLGTTVVSATSHNGITAQCTVEVVDQFVLVSGVTISQSAIELYIGESYTLTASVNPYNATVKGITWDTSIGGTVTCINGTVKAIKDGYANVFAISKGVDSDGDHRQATCEVTVKKHSVDTIIFADNSKKLKVGDKITMKATAWCVEKGKYINPSYPGVTWSSSNENVATIDPTTGALVAHSVGTAVIFATSVDATSTLIGDVHKVESCVVEVIDGSVSNGGTEGIGFKKLF